MCSCGVGGLAKSTSCGPLMDIGCNPYGAFSLSSGFRSGLRAPRFLCGSRLTGMVPAPTLVVPWGS